MKSHRKFEARNYFVLFSSFPLKRKRSIFHNQLLSEIIRKSLSRAIVHLLITLRLFITFSSRAFLIKRKGRSVLQFIIICDNLYQCHSIKKRLTSLIYSKNEILNLKRFCSVIKRKKPCHIFWNIACNVYFERLDY